MLTFDRLRYLYCITATIFTIQVHLKLLAGRVFRRTVRAFYELFPALHIDFEIYSYEPFHDFSIA